MFCSKCGAKLNDDALFCNNCGAKVGETVADSQIAHETAPNSDFAEDNKPLVKNNKANSASPEAVSSKKSKVGIICILLIAIIAVCALIVLLLANTFGGNSTSKGSLVLVYDSMENVTHIIYNNRMIDDTIQSDVSESYCESSLNGGTYALKADDNTLYFIDGQGVKTVAYDVRDFSLAYSGNNLAYADSDGNISIFDNSTKEKIKVARDCSTGGNSGYHLCISPDGKCVAFADYSDNEYTMYVYYNGEKNRIAKNTLPLTVSNNADSFFAHDKNNNLYYVDKEGEKEKLSSSAYSTCYLNSLGTEIIYSEHDETNDATRYYYFIVGGDKAKISDSSTFPLINVYYPNNTLYRWNSNNYLYIVPSQTLMNGSIYLRESTNNWYSSDNSSNIVFVNKMGEKDATPCSTSSSWYYSGDYYFTNDTFIYDNKIYMNGKASNINLENIRDIVFANNGQSAYYTRYEESTETVNLYYGSINGRNEVKLYNDISNSTYSMKVYDDRYLLLKIGDHLYISDNGSEKISLSDDYAYIIQDRITGQIRNNTYIQGVAYISKSLFDNKNDVYTVSSGTNHTNILSNISNPTYFNAVVSNANSIASDLSSSIWSYLTDAEMNGYGLYQSDSCILDFEIDDAGKWNVVVSDIYAFNSSLATSWTSQAVGDAHMKEDDYKSDATAMLAIRLANYYPDLKNACFEAYLYNGYCQALWYTSETSSIEDVSSFSHGKNCYEYGWSDYYNWTSGTKGISYEGYIIGTSPELY